LRGGCHCRSTIYTIKMPSSPAEISGAPGYQAPIRDFDHCKTNRKTSGSLFQSWLIVPQ
ncbi:hypothetical protein BDQ12DRAFT_563756, partial [Crucibulum laeve]